MLSSSPTSTPTLRADKILSPVYKTEGFCSYELCPQCLTSRELRAKAALRLLQQ